MFLDESQIQHVLVNLFHVKQTKELDGNMTLRILALLLNLLFVKATVCRIFHLEYILILELLINSDKILLKI